MTSVEGVGERDGRNIRSLRASLAEARRQLESAISERAPERAITALRGQVVELLEKIDRLQARKRFRR